MMPNKNARRQKAYRTGRRAELVAALFLMCRGYRIVAWRFRTPVGEIDLIVRNRHRLAFVEVKGRLQEEEALRAVTARQQKRIRAAARYWLARQGKAVSGDLGFDVVTVRPFRIPHHYRDVFFHSFS